MAEPWVAYPELLLQVRDIVRVLGIVAPLAPLGAGTRGNFVLPSPGDKMGTGDLWRMAPYGKARQTSETGPCGDCRRFRVLRTRGVSIGRKIVLSRSLGYKMREIAICLNVNLTPG